MRKSEDNAVLTAVVTGASSGIGLEFCHRLAERGHRIVMVSNQENELIRFASEISQKYAVEVYTFNIDLTQENADLIASHINSYHRKSIDSTPYSLSLQFFHKDILDLLNLKEISAESVTLNRSLLK